MKRFIIVSAVICSFLSFVMSAAALWMTMNGWDRNTLGLYRLQSEYDFSTPENALKSEYKIRGTSDILAIRAFGHSMSKRYARPIANSLVIHKKTDYRGEVLLFTSWEEANGDKKFQVVSVLKDPETGMWLSSGNKFDWDIDDHSELATQISEWNAKKSDSDL